MSSDDHDDKAAEHINASNKVELENGNVDAQIDISEDSSAPLFGQVPRENGVVDDSDLGSELTYNNKSSNGTGATENTSIQEELQHKPASGNDSVVPNAIPEAHNLSESENLDSSNDSGHIGFDGNITTDMAVSVTELEESPSKAEQESMSHYDDDHKHTNTEQLDKMTSSSGNVSSTTGSVADLPNDNVNVDVAVDPQSNIPDPEFSPQEDLENFPSALAKDLEKMPQVSAEGHTSFLEEQITFENDQDRVNNIETKSSNSESPNSGVFFSSPGIPAPSIVSTAVQVPPGKVLIPAAIDLVQGQALAALQVLKVILCSHFFEGS